MTDNPLPEWDERPYYGNDIAPVYSDINKEVVRDLRRQLHALPSRNATRRYLIAFITLVAGTSIWLTEELNPYVTGLVSLLCLVIVIQHVFGKPQGPDSATAAKVRSLAIRNLTEKHLIVDTIEAQNGAELLDPAMRGKEPMFSDLTSGPFRTTVDRFSFLANNYAQMCYNRKLNFEHSHFKFEQNPGGRKPGSSLSSQYDAIVIQALIDILEGRVDGTGDNGGVEKMQ
ncbi:hypothetical protein KDL29_03925 [bacterium]|nr:hypothetical protein [bacterium]